MPETAEHSHIRRDGDGKASVNKYLGKALLVALGILSSMVVQSQIHPAANAAQLDLAGIAQSNVQRIAKLEAVVFQMQDIPKAVYAQTEAITTLKASVDKIGEKLDRHIGRGPE
jgi:hypothetical protein